MVKQLVTLMGIFALLVAAMATSVSVNAAECAALNAVQADRACLVLKQDGRDR